jgi:hypothetical protein
MVFASMVVNGQIAAAVQSRSLRENDKSVRKAGDKPMRPRPPTAGQVRAVLR